MNYEWVGFGPMTSMLCKFQICCKNSNQKDYFDSCVVFYLCGLLPTYPSLQLPLTLFACHGLCFSFVIGFFSRIIYSCIMQGGGFEQNMDKQELPTKTQPNTMSIVHFIPKVQTFCARKVEMHKFVDESCKWSGLFGIVCKSMSKRFVGQMCGDL